MTPRRRFRRPYVAPPLDPLTFVRRIAAKVGTEYGMALTRNAFEIVNVSGDPDPWIAAVRRARDTGLLSSEVAWFLIDKFVDEAMHNVVYTDPELEALGKRIEEIERAHGLSEDESFFVGEGPPDWEEATAAWDVVYKRRFAEIFHRVGEEEMAGMSADAWEDPRERAGREAIFGPDEELDGGDYGEDVEE